MRFLRTQPLLLLFIQSVTYYTRIYFVLPDILHEIFINTFTNGSRALCWGGGPPTHTFSYPQTLAHVLKTNMRRMSLASWEGGEFTVKLVEIYFFEHVFRAINKFFTRVCIYLVFRIANLDKLENSFDALDIFIPS